MDMRQVWRTRRASQRMLPVLDACEFCGSTENLERHHYDYSDPGLFHVLCRKCHRKWHSDERRPSRMKNCAICGTEFLPSHSKKHKTCSKKCLSEIGRRNARKRWGKESAALEPSETPSSRPSRRSSAAPSSRPTG